MNKELEAAKEAMDYFRRNNKLFLGSTGKDNITFVVKDCLSYWDEDGMETIINNPRYIKDEDMKRLMYAIFVERVLKIKFCAAYTFQFGEYEYVSDCSNYPYGAEMNDCMPNPHSLPGEYKRIIDAYIHNNDYISAIEQCIVVCKSLNCADFVAMELFIKQMYGVDDCSGNRCIELPDGGVVSTREAIVWLKKHEEE